MRYKELLTKLIPEKMPGHVAVIMDGNGRWAERHGTSRINGHKKGVEAVRRTVETAVEAGLKYLTIYAFSTENWARSKKEVNYLLKLIMDSLVREIDELNRNGVNIRFLGSKENLSESYSRKVIKTCEKSWQNDKLYLNVAMNYGGRKEIIEAFKKVSVDIRKGKLNPDDIDDNLFGEYLYTAGMPDPDLIIRTSGEQRLSNFLVWQSAYSELWFTDTLWPDFSREDLVQAMLDYQNRDRRYGGRNR
jgi:undecaprenyl diphosphate synthase